MMIPFDYRSILENRVVLITGMGRSGTSILADLIGSFDSVFYLHEPHIMYFGPTMPVKVFRCVVCEDYLFPLLREGTRRGQLDYIENHNPTFLIKTCETLQNNRWFSVAFPGARRINIVRDGNNVVSSAVKKGWYTNEYMEERIIDFVDRR